MSNAPRRSKTKIMVFGVFDGLHGGHINFFHQARTLDRHPYLVVSVARDRNVRRLKKKTPLYSEKKRLSDLKKSNLANKVVLGGMKDHLPHILREKPDIIALGYDQKFYVKNLKKDLKDKGLLVKVVRLRPYREKIYKSSLLHLYLTSRRRSVIRNPRRRIAPRTKKR